MGNHFEGVPGPETLSNLQSGNNSDSFVSISLLLKFQRCLLAPSFFSVFFILEKIVSINNEVPFI
jgi:hypothetical protein